MDESTVSSTRVFVTGLPPSLTNEELRKHFSQKYQVTDAQIVSGRRFGFVGFKDETSAKSAIKYFNKSFIRMSKINVEIAKPVDIERQDGQKARPATRRNQPPTSSHITQPFGTITKPGQTLKRKRGEEEDPQQGKDGEQALPQFDGLGEKSSQRNEETSAKKAKAVKGPELMDVTERPTTQEEEDTNGAEEDDTPVDQGTADEVMDDVNQPVTSALDDDEWLRSKTSRVLDLVQESSAPQPTVPLNKVEPTNSINAEPVDDSDESDQPADDGAAPETTELKPDFPTTKRLFIRNLPYTTENSDLIELFSQKFPGQVEEVHVVKDRRTNNSKGFAYVSFKQVESAQQAALELDGQSMQGRILHVLPATDKPSNKLDDFEISKLPLKTQRLLKRKAESTTSTLSWNSLYMNPDAVISSIADRLGVSKSQVLDPTSSEAAVKQAQAETHVIQETKAYFTKFGVDFDAFNDKPRGGRALLVKNLAYSTTSDELKALFNACGEVTRVLLPPSGVIAIVEFAEEDQAHRAMKQLAYRNLKGSVLYLEKAPKDVFLTAAGKSEGDKDSKEAISAEAAGDGDEASGASYTLFVRNLNFSTTSAVLSDAFRPLEGFLSAKVKTKTDPKRPGEILSMGYGFVEFKTKQEAQIALRTMNGYRLENHELLVKFSHQPTDGAEERRREDLEKKNAAKKTKIIIKNLPFEATKKDIRSLFGAYGQLRSVRVPQKFDRSTRGFAFAEFVTAREAEHAMDALKNTHLLGRRLVLEFTTADVTDPEEEIRAMERKMGQQADKVEHQKITGPGQRRKFVVGGARDEMEGD